MLYVLIAAAVVLGDLYQFDPTRLTWTDLSDPSWNLESTAPPSAR
jgi:hypothetical protein